MMAQIHYLKINNPITPKWRTIQSWDSRSRVANSARLFPLRESRYRYGSNRQAALKREEPNREKRDLAGKLGLTGLPDDLGICVAR
jgi:hypothetical protein